MSIPSAYLQEAILAIKWALEWEPRLTRNGYPTPDTAGCKIEPLDPRCVATALGFIDLGPVRILRTPHGNRGSYGLKHDAERWGKLHGWEPYVANGDVIAALHYRQVPIKRDGRNSPNCSAGVRVDQLKVAAWELASSRTIRTGNWLMDY